MLMQYEKRDRAELDTEELYPTETLEWFFARYWNVFSCEHRSFVRIVSKASTSCLNQNTSSGGPTEALEISYLSSVCLFVETISNLHLVKNRSRHIRRFRKYLIMCECGMNAVEEVGPKI